MHYFFTKLFAFLFSLFLRFTCGLNRLSITRPDIFQKYSEQGNNIFAFWHSKLFYLTYYYVKNAKKKKVSVLVSMSKDGDYGAALLDELKQDVVRGSTTKGGQKAIRELAERAMAGNNVAITPDGPRGPAFNVNEGVIRLAQITGARIIPVGYDATRKRELKSWDSFIIVQPFGKVHVAFAEPIQVPRDINSDEVEKYRKVLEETLLGLDQTCAKRLKLYSGK